ncbi:MAG: hypothetical protein ACRDYZ_07860 [Acidimicrobiales bacterium]
MDVMAGDPDPAAATPDAAPGDAVTGPDVLAPDGVATVVHGGARELGDVGAPAEQWEAFGVRAESVEGWKALDFGPFEAAMAQGDGYGPESARHLAKPLRELARAWRHVGLASAEGLRWHRAGFEAREAARFQDEGVPLDRALAAGGGHRLAG